MLNQILKQLRQARKLTQTELAEQLNVSQSTVASWENGKRRPDIDFLPTIAAFYGVSVDLLVGNPPPEDVDPWQLRERLRADPDMRALFSAATKATPEHIRAVTATLKALEPGESEE